MKHITCIVGVARILRTASSAPTAVGSFSRAAAAQQTCAVADVEFGADRAIDTSECSLDGSGEEPPTSTIPPQTVVVP